MKRILLAILLLVLLSGCIKQPEMPSVDFKTPNSMCRNGCHEAGYKYLSTNYNQDYWGAGEILWSICLCQNKTEAIELWNTK